MTNYFTRTINLFISSIIASRHKGISLLINQGFCLMIFTIVFCLMVAVPSFAQRRQTGLKVVPIPHLNPTDITKGSVPQGRTLAVGDTISLPFWDDFSSKKRNNFAPDSTKWTNTSSNVRVNFTQAVNPPTLGIATFDGTQGTGIPHSTVSTATGLADSLISKPINLAAVPAAERNTVFLSFFWELKGYGEFPDEEDSLVLEFKDNTGNWQTQWRMSGGQEITDNFQQVILPVSNPAFFHAGFQFRFKNFARLSGAFDEWHIDYVFLNKNRRASNTSYLDRAITTLPTSIFRNYTAIPMEQFKANPQQYIDTTSIQIYNLDVVLQPITYSSRISNKATGEVLEIMDNGVVLDPLLLGQQRRTIKATPVSVASFNTELESLTIEAEMLINSGDKQLIGGINGTDTTFIPAVDFRVNDTARATFVLNDYYAYDDGSAELGVGVNQSGGKLAYQFVVNQPAFLEYIDINFPATGNSSSTSIVIYVWRDLDDNGQEVFYRRQSGSVGTPASIDEFQTFQLSSPVQVKDTIYIGFEQQTDDFLAVGLDKNTNSGDKIFFNVNGTWEQNQDVAGSLLIRPRFGERPTAVDDDIEENEDITIYPNPNQGNFYIKGEVQEIQILDILGRLVPFSVESSQTELKEINLQTNRPGIYLITLTTSKTKVTKRVVLY